MARTQQTFVNRKDTPIYVSVEPWPECFELEPGDKLTLIWDTPDSCDATEVHFINERELVIEPEGGLPIQYLINGVDAKTRSWKFKHK